MGMKRQFTRVTTSSLRPSVPANMHQAKSVATSKRTPAERYLPKAGQRHLSLLTTKPTKDNAIIQERGFNFQSRQSENSEETEDSQDIQAHWKKEEKLKAQRAVDYQQGNFRYPLNDPTRIHISDQLANLECFYFDHTIPVDKLLADFKADVIHRGIRTGKRETKA